MDELYVFICHHFFGQRSTELNVITAISLVFPLLSFNLELLISAFLFPWTIVSALSLHWSFIFWRGPLTHFFALMSLIWFLLILSQFLTYLIEFLNLLLFLLPQRKIFLNFFIVIKKGGAEHIELLELSLLLLFLLLLPFIGGRRPLLFVI